MTGVPHSMGKWITGAFVAVLGVISILVGARDAGASATPASQIHVVVIENMKFTPSRLEIRPGDRVTFRNSDLVPHTATTKMKQPTGFDSGYLKPGESWTVSPQAKEPIHYACTFHPVMEGVIVVKQ